MADVINLRRARKAKQRAEREAAADANRLSFGRGKAERRETALRTAQAERVLDGHRLAGSDDQA